MTFGPSVASSVHQLPKTRRSKIQKVLHEYKEGSLHSGSKQGPKVRSRKQAIAIALNQARKSGADIPPRRVSRGHYGKRGGKRAA